MSKTSTSVALLAALLLGALVLVLCLTSVAHADACPNEAIREAQHATFLSDCRAYEMVSPPDKNGGQVIPDSPRTRASADGSAVEFASLTPSGQAVGSSIATEFLAERSPVDPGPLGTGWTAHPITPPQDAMSVLMFNASLEPRFVGEFSPSFEAGVFSALTPLTEDPDVANLSNLYVRSDLRAHGAGAYRLVTSCPRCEQLDASEGPGKGVLPAPAESLAALAAARPSLAAVSSDTRTVLFESVERLTPDAPGGGAPKAFESEDGTVRLAGRVPSGAAVECDDVAGPACVPAHDSKFGQQVAPEFEHAGNKDETERPNVLSDGSDGHRRAFVTVPVAAEPSGHGGRLYVREDGHYTAELNVPELEGEPPGEFAPAYFEDASANGERAFFTTAQALTPDAPHNGFEKLYMYDTTKPGSDPHNLTFIASAGEVAQDATVRESQVIGVSRDGSYVYFTALGPQLVQGAPPLSRLGRLGGVYLWHEGMLSFVREQELAVSPAAALSDHESTTRVTPDGSRLLFLDTPGRVTTPSVYLYDAPRSTPTNPDLVCVFCVPGLQQEVFESGVTIEFDNGAALPGVHESQALSDDGRFVFFNTTQALVPEDHNEVDDAYEYDTVTRTLHLLSSGAAGARGSWFLDASASGSDVFIATSQQLVGWDRDGAYDVYDVRVNGGFPEPAVLMSCASVSDCASSPSGEGPPSPGGSLGARLGNPPVPPPPPPHKLGCPRGEHLARVHGQLRCARPPCPHGERRVRVRGRSRCVKVLAHRRSLAGHG